MARPQAEVDLVSFLIAHSPFSAVVNMISSTTRPGGREFSHYKPCAASQKGLPMVVPRSSCPLPPLPSRGPIFHDSTSLKSRTKNGLQIKESASSTADSLQLPQEQPNPCIRQGQLYFGPV
jgi:hypothetical protein